MSSFTGTRHLVRLVLRRDRVRLPVWVLSITALMGLSAGAVVELYDTPEKRAGYSTIADSPATRLLSGRPDDLDTVGAITAYEVSVSGLVAVALMVMFLVVRHTRTEEETGRAELVRSTVTGRHAATLAAVGVAALASLVVGALDAAVMAGAGLDLEGSLLHGAVMAATGLVFTALTAAIAQITSAGRGALGITGAVLALTFVVRGVGDVAENFLSWTSPLGWALLAQPYGEARWWLLAPLALTAVALLAVAAWLTAHRDEGAGMLQPSPGRARARDSLGTATGLAWRLQRGSVLGWGTGLVIGGALFGSVGPEIRTMIETNPELAQFFELAGADPVEAFLVTGIGLLAVVASAFAVSSSLRLRAEESAGRSESLLATGLSRTRWVLGSLTVTLLATVVLMAVVGLATSVTFAAASGDAGSIGRVTAASVALVPAVLVLAGVAVLLTGWLPRWSPFAFALVVFAFVQVYLGGLLDFPGWVDGLSPFHHLPQMPVEPFAAAPTLAMTALALALGAAGLVGVRRRDITG